MCVEAITWALKQPVKRSAAKFVLVVLANSADAEHFQCWPSTAYLCEATAQDRKTVLDAIRRLLEEGFISDTGERRGATKQIPVYRLNGSENGIVKEARNRNGSENGTVPKTDGNSPVFPMEQSRFSLETVPKTGHGAVRKRKETSGNRHTHEKRLPVTAFAIPEWMPLEAWKAYSEMRVAKKKPMNTVGIVDRIIGRLDGFRRSGHDVTAILDNSTCNGWTDVYEPKSAASRPDGRSGVHIGQQDYTAGWDGQ